MPLALTAGVSDATAAIAHIRQFLETHEGQFCPRCVARAVKLDELLVRSVLKPSKDRPYTFMPEECQVCGAVATCVAFAERRAQDRVHKVTE